MQSEFYKMYKEFMNPCTTPDETNAGNILVLHPSLWAKLADCGFEVESLKLFFDCLPKNECLEYFKFGIECISSFIQANFTGPDLPEAFEAFFNDSSFKVFDWAKAISLGCEDISVKMKYPVLLFTAKCIFKMCSVDPLANIWWQWRSIIIHQQILDSLSPVLLSEANILHKRFEDLNLDEDIRAELEIEQAQLYNLYRQVSIAETHINAARNLLKIDYDLIGKIGKRTKFQQTEVAQLTLRVNAEERPPVEQEFEVPQNVSLKDDLILENIKFIDEEEHLQNLSVLDQKFLLASLQLKLISEPQDNLFYEEIEPFINFILKQNNTWVIRVVTVLIRCKFEAKHKRTIERCLMQCETIVSAIKKPTPASQFRIYDVYSTGIPPIWKTEELLGNVMLGLGLVKAALDVFLSLQNWEAVITCYTILKLRHKAVEVIQQQLSVKPSTKLWCYLGDATDDEKCYEKAWEFSNQTSFLAQRQWGLFYYNRQQYEESIFHLEKSVALNPLQPSAWLYLGYAALESEKWESAAAAYRQYTSIEPGSFETWNNLAKAYIKLGNKRAAHQALHDAIRCNYDNWKVWDNLMAVSADIGHHSDIIQSYHRILDLKEKHLDTEVLTVLVHGVCSSHSDDNSTGHLMQKTRELLGRISSIFPSNGEVWELYAELAPDQFVKSQRLQRALKGYSNPEWEKNPDRCLKVLDVCKILVECALTDGTAASNIILHSIKLSLKSIVSVVKKLDYVDACKVNEIEELLTKLIQKIEDGNII